MNNEDFVSKVTLAKKEREAQENKMGLGIIYIDDTLFESKLD